MYKALGASFLEEVSLSSNKAQSTIEFEHLFISTSLNFLSERGHQKPVEYKYIWA